MAMTLTLSPAEIVAAAERSGSPGLLACHRTWERVSLDEIAEVLNGCVFSSSAFNYDGDGVPLVRIRDVERGTSRTFYSGTYESDFLVEPGDILVGMDGDFRVAVWRGATSLLNQRVCRVSIRKSAHYNRKFLLYALQGYLDAICAVTSSVTVKHLSSRSLQQIPLPLPPLAEQCRIVDALEDHLSRIAGVLDIINRCQTRAGHLWEATLRNVANGTLLGGSVALEVLPVSEVAEVGGGIQKQKKRIAIQNAYPFLRVANVARGKLDLDNVHEVELFDGELEKYRLEQGDLLVVEGNGSPDQIGRAASWNGAIKDAVHQNHLIRVRPGGRLTPRYLELIWNSPFVVDQLREVARSTSGLYTLSTSKVKAIKIPVPSIADQNALVERADEWQMCTSSARSSLQRAGARTASLRRALLGRAFSGKLVPQDPNDEPASVLLERIRAERAVQGGTAKRAAPRPRKKPAVTKDAATKDLPPPPASSTPTPVYAVQQELPL